MLKKTLFAIVLGALFISCSSNSNDGDVNVDGGIVDNFDRSALLVNLADNIIIPAYQDFAVKMSTLKSAGETFTTTPNQTNLDQVRSAWLTAYRTWQYVEMFNIGEGLIIDYRFNMNVFPLTQSDVDNNIANGGYDLTSVNNQDAQGFPALDYLLFGIGTNDTEILAKYTSNPNSQGFKSYLTDILSRMNTLTQQVTDSWNNGYRNSFVSNDGNSATSSLNIFVNVYVEYYERLLRANKIGIPAGVFSGGPLPEKVEGLFSGIYSKQLALDALDSFEDVFNGRAYGSSSIGESFKSYLTYLERNDINSSITSQIAAARVQLSGLSDNFNQQVSNDNTQMLMAYDELQKVVVFIKNDMPNAFNVSIVFQDNDGD